MPVPKTPSQPQWVHHPPTPVYLKPGRKKKKEGYFFGVEKNIDTNTFLKEGYYNIHTKDNHFIFMAT